MPMIECVEHRHAQPVDALGGAFEPGHGTRSSLVVPPFGVKVLEDARLARAVDNDSIRVGNENVPGFAELEIREFTQEVWLVEANECIDHVDHLSLRVVHRFGHHHLGRVANPVSDGLRNHATPGGQRFDEIGAV